MIEKGKKKLSKFPKINWIKASAENFPNKKNFFDFYTISFGLRNTKDLNKAIKEAYRVLKPGGKLLFTVWAFESDEYSKKKNFKVLIS